MEILFFFSYISIGAHSDIKCVTVRSCGELSLVTA